MTRRFMARVWGMSHIRAIGSQKVYFYFKRFLRDEDHEFDAAIWCQYEYNLPHLKYPNFYLF
jgi:hypothetical protein